MSIEEAAEDIAGGSDGQTIVVLLTDGGEDSGGDPVKAAKAFNGKRNVQFFVVGFDINRERWTQQLRAMAQAGGGRYRPVRQAEQLTADLKSIVYPEPPQFIVRDANGEQIATGAFGGKSIQLKPGQYSLLTQYLGQEFKPEFWINGDSTTHIAFDASKIVPVEEVTHTSPAASPEREASPPAQNTENESQTSTATPTFCTNCGAKLKPGAKFCTQCGQRVQP